MFYSTMRHAGKRFIVLMLVLLAGASAHADESLRIAQPWIRLLPGDLPLAGYFELVNTGDAPATLVGAESPGFGGIMLHRTITEGGSARMEHVMSVEVPAGGSIRFEPGSYHLMLMMRRDALHTGDHVAISLRFKDGGRLTADFELRSAGAS